MDDYFMSNLKVETKRINDILDSDYTGQMTLEEYHYEKGRADALEYVLKRLNEILEEE